MADEASFAVGVVIAVALAPIQASVAAAGVVLGVATWRRVERRDAIVPDFDA